MLKERVLAYQQRENHLRKLLQTTIDNINVFWGHKPLGASRSSPPGRSRNDKAMAVDPTDNADGQTVAPQGGELVEIEFNTLSILANVAALPCS